MSSFDEMDAFDGASLSARAMAARPQPYLEGLNPAQRAAVEHMDGPVLMLAGAGTGKTTRLTARIVHLLNTGRARPNEDVGCDFYQQGRARDEDPRGVHVGSAVEGMPWLGTFHAICVKLLRRHAELVGLKSNFTILDTDDQLRLLKQLVGAGDSTTNAGLRACWLGSLTVGRTAHGRRTKYRCRWGAYNHKGRELYAAYQARLIELNASDFGDLLSAHGHDLPDPSGRVGAVSALVQISSSSTSIRTPTSRNTCGCACWRGA